METQSIGQPYSIKNVGWTLGAYCPFSCKHCYSAGSRVAGMELSDYVIDRVVSQLLKFGIRSVNLGGNEPIFTNGRSVSKSKLPFIIQRLHEAGLTVGLTTAGISAIKLFEVNSEAFSMLNDIDISLDSPFSAEHDSNRGASLFNQALDALSLCQRQGKPASVVMCAMNWNFTERHIEALVSLASRHDAMVRINPLKPVSADMLDLMPGPDQYYQGFAHLVRLCYSLEVGEPPLAAAMGLLSHRRCPCGANSFRIHSLTAEGRLHVSPCVYLHDQRSDLDLMCNELAVIVRSPAFAAFQTRRRDPGEIAECRGCSSLDVCGGGCAARAYLWHKFSRGADTLLHPDPYCPRDHHPGLLTGEARSPSGVALVHADYLCTWIGRPKERL